MQPVTMPSRNKAHGTANQDGTRRSFFGGLPTRGVWDAVGLTRGQFLWILVLSTALFLIWDGPVWRHLRETHVFRIGWSYVAIFPMTAWAQKRNGTLDAYRWFGAIILLSAIKLVITAVLLIAFALARV